jgi:hypothetical protein
MMYLLQGLRCACCVGEALLAVRAELYLLRSSSSASGAILAARLYMYFPYAVIFCTSTTKSNTKKYNLVYFGVRKKIVILFLAGKKIVVLVSQNFLYLYFIRLVCTCSKYLRTRCIFLLHVYVLRITLENSFAKVSLFYSD